MAELLVSDVIRPRPVWARYLARQRGEALPAKLTEEEKVDVIAVLRQRKLIEASLPKIPEPSPYREGFVPYVLFPEELYREAERLFLTYGVRQ